jgi:hypothetical protein
LALAENESELFWLNQKLTAQDACAMAAANGPEPSKKGTK